MDNPTMGLPSRANALKALSTQASPFAQAQSSQGQQSADVGLQQAVQAAIGTGAAPTAGQLQQMGGQQATAKGKVGLEAAAEGMQKQSALGGAVIQNEQEQGRADLASKSLALNAENQKLQTALAEKSMAVKQELVDKQLQFAKDDMGRTLFNERQLMDYTIHKAQSQEELMAYEQKVQQLSKRKMQMLQTAYKKVVQSMEQANTQYNQSMNNALKAQLAASKQALEKKIAQERADQANRAGMFTAAGTIIGAVFGGVAGAAVGGGIGSAAAGSTA